MTDIMLGNTQPIDVAIIGGGPSGLSAAIELKNLGVARVVVLERESEAGGIPRHCGHPPFGMREFKRILTGPNYARKLVKLARSKCVEMHLLTTVVEALPDGVLQLITKGGIETIQARKVIYATGAREAPRSARLISGDRIAGITNTGALQSMIYLKGRRPFKRPVIIGTELVSFSAIMTCRHAGIKPVAMIEERSQTTAQFPVSLYPRILDIPLHLNNRLISISGNIHVEEIEIERNGIKRTIACDGVILSGRFVPESTLARSGHIAVDPASGGPVVDQYGRCTDPAYFATGNLLRPVETAGWCWNEGRQTARRVVSQLVNNTSNVENQFMIYIMDPFIKLVMPQRVCTPLLPTGMKDLQLRFTGSAKGDLVISNRGMEVYRKTISALPERRILVPLAGLVQNTDSGSLEVSFKERAWP